MTLRIQCRRALPAILACVLICNLFVLGQSAHAADVEGKYAGVFQNEKMTLALQPDAQGQITGTLTLGDKKLPVTAQVQDDKLVGKFVSGGSSFDFTASVDGGAMQFASGVHHYALKKLDNPLDQPAAGGNPLDPAAGPAKNPADQAAAPAGNSPVLDLAPPNGWWPTLTTAHGQTWTTILTGQSAKDTLHSVCTSRIPRLFSTKCAFADSVLDNKDQSALVQFAAKVKDRVMRGEFICTVLPAGIEVSVILADADAPAEEFAALAKAVPVAPRMQPVQLPQGMGVIDLPEGWKVVFSDPMIGSVVVYGPNGEMVLISSIRRFITPDGAQTPTGQAAAQTGAIVSEFLPPIDAIKASNDAAARQNPDNQASIEKVITNDEIKQNDPNTIAANMDYIWLGQGKTHRRAAGLFSCVRFGGGNWILSISALDAPANNFNQEYLTMELIQASYQENNQAVAEYARGVMIDLKQVSDAQRDAVYEQAKKAFADREESRQAAAQTTSAMSMSTAVHLSSQDTATMSGGTLQMIDTQTGESTPINLYNADEIVNAANQEAGSQRYIRQKMNYEK